MHPIRGYVPTQDDFKLLEDIWSMLLFDYPSSKLGEPLPDRIDLDLTLGDDTGE
jgi:hypothetical protein